jgi:hypothetical protein
MPRNKHNKHNKKQHGKQSSPAVSRPLQGIDEKTFVLNDIVPIVITNPTNSVGLLCIIEADVNGYTWTV